MVVPYVLRRIPTSAYQRPAAWHLQNRNGQPVKTAPLFIWGSEGVLFWALSHLQSDDTGSKHRIKQNGQTSRWNLEQECKGRWVKFSIDSVLTLCRMSQETVVLNFVPTLKWCPKHNPPFFIHFIQDPRQFHPKRHWAGQFVDFSAKCMCKKQAGVFN